MCLDSLSTSYEEFVLTTRRSHPGCTCPDGFVGEHCEYLEGSENASELSNDASNGSDGGSVRTEKRGGGLIVVLIILIVVLAGLIGWSLYRKRSGKEIESESPPIPEPEPMQSNTNIAPPTDESSDMTMSDASTAGTKDLQTVEII